MSYQSFLSDILKSKYYKLEEINDLSQTLQRNSGVKISYLEPSSTQIRLQCPYKLTNTCEFSYTFTKTIDQDQNKKYELVKCISNHSNSCEICRKGPQLVKAQSFQDKQRKQSQSQLTCQNNSLQSSPKSPLIKEIRRRKSSLNNQKLYSQQQLSLLKKQLEFQSKGLLSRSTQFDNETNIVKKIQFHCKYEQNCPYLAILESVHIMQDQNQDQKLLFSLHVVNNTHFNQCVLQDQIICYNRNTMKIDRQIQLLTRVIQNNQKNTKPKDILKKVAEQLGQSQEFIYQGLIKKINKRAIKKYFDNCVAKVRSKLQTKFNKPSAVGYKQVINMIKDNKKQKNKNKNQEEFIYKTRKNHINNTIKKSPKKSLNDSNEIISQDLKEANIYIQLKDMKDIQ